MLACNVLVCNRTYVPPIDVRAEASVVWTPEAEARMEGVPAAARGLARTAVLRWCTERGHSVVSSGDVDVALDDLMPYRRTMRRIEEVSSALDAATAAMLDEARPESARSICRTCGYAARTETPARCPVCGGDADSFEQIDVDVRCSCGTSRGRDGKRHLRRSQARMDARGTHAPPAAAGRVSAPTGEGDRGEDGSDDDGFRQSQPTWPRPSSSPRSRRSTPAPARIAPHSEGMRRPSRGEGRAHLPWNAEAQERIERIPGGFLRSLAVEQVERLAIALKASEVTVLHAEAGIAEARARMRAHEPAPAATEASGCPVHQPPSPNTDRPECPHVLNEVTAPVVDSLGRRQVANGELVHAGDATLP